MGEKSSNLLLPAPLIAGFPMAYAGGNLVKKAVVVAAGKHGGNHSYQEDEKVS